MRHRYIPNGEVDYGNTLELTYHCDANFMDRMIIEAWQSFVHTADVSTRTKFDNGTGPEGHISFLRRVYRSMFNPCIKKRRNTIIDLCNRRMFPS